MFKKIKNTLDKVVKLASETPRDGRYDKHRKELDDFLEELTFEEVKIIQTIASLGESENYKESDTYIERYKKRREELDKFGWSTKELEISHMANKVNFEKNLRKGMEILNI